MTTFDLTADGTAAVASTTSPGRVRAHERTARPARRSRRRWFRAGSLWLQAAVFALALGAGLFTGYLINR
jgi:hypothetical protein